MRVQDRTSSARGGAGLWSSFAAPVLRAPMVPVFVIAFILFCFTVEGFTSVANLGNMARLFAPLLIAAIGATFVFLLGGIDLSVGSTLSLASVVGASLMRDTGSIALGVAGGIGTGLAIGAINGTAIAVFRLPAFVHTLGMLLTLRAVALLVTAGHSVGRLPPGVMAFGRGNLAGVPNLLWLAALVYVAAAIVLRHSEFGRELFLVGSNERAARFSGLRVVRAKFLAYLLCGGLAGLSGIAVVFRLGSGGPILGDNLLLMAIAAVVLGGTNILGGRGTYLGTVAGVILIVLLQSILAVMQMQEAFRQMIYGVVIVAMLLVYGRGAKVHG
ncbi:MAG TPA: ABC transporter permease [Candidatus Acidoferrum sp.]|nr:ABC transporter permease [Candidatus Acidoferrum sp.]